MRNYLSEAFRQEDEALATLEASEAIAEIQDKIENLLDNLFLHA